MSKNCLQCGHTNDEKAKFCAHCGARFSPEPENAAVENGRNLEKTSEKEEFMRGPEGVTKQSAEVDSGKNSGDASAESSSFSEEISDADRIRAEWQGTDCRCYGGGKAGNTPAPHSGAYPDSYGSVSPGRNFQGGLPEYYETRRRQWTEEARKARLASKRKTLFALAFVGLLLDFIYGIGFLMSVPVA